jgi:hypothetical protein
LACIRDRHSQRTQVRDGLGDEAVVNLLGLVDFVATGNTAGVIVGDPLIIVPDIGADIAVHDLHVVDRKQQLHAGRIHALAHIDSKSDVAANLAACL